ncbi:fasciclin-like arabinogalactan protein 2 [Lolium perenne]|uniref:fasciclin-like arabinogalactan protein 2 n=1 Tax=Lolium perenne TaxID=4522 RepID=UPI0021EB1A35|nr:fasciclin-like arabinogalactan protein 2 [Lolium perenne]
MAALFVLVLVLAVSGCAAGDDEAMLPRLKLRDVSMNGCGNFVSLLNVTANASDISHSQRRILVGRGGGLTVFCPDEAWQGLVDLMSKNGCGSFAGLLSATASAAEIFHEHLLGGGGLTVFCPDDKAVAAFDPTFRSLAAGDRVAVLLYHGVAACYGRERFKGFNYVSVHTLAEDAATKKNQAITVRDEGGALALWPAPPSYPNGGAWVTKTASEEAPLAVYVVDTVLLPSTVACIGYLGWLRCSIAPFSDWIMPICIMSSAGGLVGALLGVLIAEFLIPID